MATPVFVFAPQGVLDNETNVSAWLKESLPPAAPAALREFTLCLWFQVITFAVSNAIMSYAHASNSYVTLLSKLKEHKVIQSGGCWRGA